MSSPHSALINKLFKNDEVGRQLAHGFVAKFGDVPGMADRIPALLNEAARSAEQVDGGQMSPGDARAYLADFASTGLGMAPHHMTDLNSWFDNAGADIATTEQPQQPGSEPAQAEPAKPAQPASAAAAPARLAQHAPDRDAARQHVEKFERAMRAPQGSPEWASYWRNPQAQAEYRAAIDTMNGASEPSLAPGTLAEDAAEVRAAIAGTAPADPSAPA